MRTEGHRDGETYEPNADYTRLNEQMYDVWTALREGEWRTLRQIADLTGHPEASISARLRDFRKARFGSNHLEARRSSGGLWKYRLYVKDGIRFGTRVGLPVSIRFETRD